MTQRQQALQRFVTGVFRVNDPMAGIVGSARDVDIKIFEGAHRGCDQGYNARLSSGVSYAHRQRWLGPGAFGRRGDRGDRRHRGLFARAR